MTTFKQLGLSPKLVQALDGLGFVQPSPIQEKTIPFILGSENDLIALAQTGTGKTAAFSLPLLQQLADYSGKPAKGSPRALILAPTRELAAQIGESIQTYGRFLRLSHTVICGGVPQKPQVKALNRGVDIVVATPGRLLDHMGEGKARLDLTSTVILDEADQMLDLGFIHALRRIAGLLPAERQTMLFSATMPKQMEEIAASYLTHPKRVAVSPPGKAADKVTQEVHFIAKAAKPDLLIECLGAHKGELALVFGRTKHGSDKLARKLEQAGFAVAAIHGNKSQGQRERALQAFRDGKVKVLVATDVAARGLDIPDVKHVYNFELPNVADNYVHRIGRTARAGRDGAAIAFCAPEEMGELKDIQKVLGMTIPVASGRPWEVLPDPAAKKTGGPRRRGGGGFGGGGGAGGKPQGKSGGRRRRGGSGGGARANAA